MHTLRQTGRGVARLGSRPRCSSIPKVCGSGEDAWRWDSAQKRIHVKRYVFTATEQTKDTPEVRWILAAATTMEWVSSRIMFKPLSGSVALRNRTMQRLSVLSVSATKQDKVSKRTMPKPSDYTHLL